MSFFFNRKNRGIPKNATFRLTEQGREKLQSFSGDPKSRILVTLETDGTSNIDEICQSSGLNRGEVEKHISSMVSGNYIQYVGVGLQQEGEL